MNFCDCPILSIVDTTVNTQLTVMRIESMCDWLLPLVTIPGKHALERRWHDDNDNDQTKRKMPTTEWFTMRYRMPNELRSTFKCFGHTHPAHPIHPTQTYTPNLKWKIRWNMPYYGYVSNRFWKTVFWVCLHLFLLANRFQWLPFQWLRCARAGMASYRFH